jgi:hypothetical protein
MEIAQIYYSKELITTVKSFVEQSPGVVFTALQLFHNL